MHKIIVFYFFISISVSPKWNDTSMRKKIIVTGIALNDKDGAIVKTDSSYYLISGLDAWDQRYHNKKIRVVGVLRKEIHAKASTDSIWVQERVGEWLVSKKARWRLVY